MHVLVLCGGRSAEHDVSLRSAENIVEALEPKHTVYKVVLDYENHWHRSQREGPGCKLVRENGQCVLLDKTSQERLSVDVIFPIVHGPYGEDGQLQGFLGLQGVPFVGSGVLGSSICMDKDIARRLLIQAGVPHAQYIALDNREGKAQEKQAVLFAEQQGFPLFVKPANMGSSVGVRRVTNQEELCAALQHAQEFDTKVLVEEALPGREIEIAVLEGLGGKDPEVSVAGEICPKEASAGGFYSYEAKYVVKDGAELILPASLPAGILQQMQQLAKKVFFVLECEGLCRVDFFYHHPQVWVSEVNTLPGFTNISMYPQLLALSGWKLPQLLERLLELSIQRHKVRRSLAYR